MASKALDNLFTRLRALATLRQAGEFPDRELLKRFIQQHDEAAFTALVERHGSMVLTVCRRVLHHHQDAEDACQAVFLILVRKAASIRKLNSLSSWLHGVALRVSRKLRARRARLPRTVGELPAAPDEKAPACTWNDMSSVLDEELQRLPEKYRAPLVLCYLQARTRDEAAQELGWKPGTLKGRLELGRKLLHQRLARRGVALSAALLAAGLGQTVSASVPSTVVVAIVKSALEISAGKTLAASAVSHQAAWLVQEFLRVSLLKQLQMGAGVLLLVVGLASGGWVAHQALTQKPGNSSLAEVAAPSLPDEPIQEPAPPTEVPAAAPGEKQDAVRNETPPLLPEQPPVNHVARCAECHTFRNLRGELAISRPNLSAKRREREREDDDFSERARRWSEDKLIAFLTTPRKDDVIAAHQLTVDDARAVVASLRSLPPRRKGEGRRDE